MKTKNKKQTQNKFFTGESHRKQEMKTKYTLFSKEQNMVHYLFFIGLIAFYT